MKHTIEKSQQTKPIAVAYNKSFHDTINIFNGGEQNDFVEKQDFVTVSQNCETIRNYGNSIRKGVSVSTEYFITLDMAKELCMVENNEKGKLWRKYFITCEKMLFSFERNKYKQLNARKDTTQAVQDIYGKEAPWYVYSNYTKLVYKKVFGYSDVKHIKKIFHLSEKEELRKSPKIPIECQKKIAETEVAIYCFLKTMQYQQVGKEECYEKVREFLFGKKVLDN